jgi:hypothetical protein
VTPVHVPIDTAATAAHYVEREFGGHGYTVAAISAGFCNGLFELRASDGGVRWFLADRFGNVALAPDGIERLDVDERSAWTRGAADDLYRRRNGYAVASALRQMRTAD